MYQVIYHEQDKIEIALEGKVTRKEMQEVNHQLESLCKMYPKINVLLDTMNADSFDPSVLLEDIRFYKEYSGHLNRMAVVGDGAAKMIANAVDKVADTEIKGFKDDDIEAARKWIFPSVLPA